MAKEPPVEQRTTATYTARKLPLMLGSLPLTILASLLLDFGVLCSTHCSKSTTPFYSTFR
jgi:hypothetical protein